MIRAFITGKSFQLLILVVVAIAVWKANNGDLGRMVESFITVLDKASDALLQVWHRVVG